MTDAEWRARLSAISYGILRHENTEVPETGPYNDEHRKGAYHCMGCDLQIFRSEWKYDHDGWPTFSQVIAANISTKRDADGERTEYHCARCLGHMGHRFPDGPKPAGLRYCNNGYALNFKPG
jgi:peptide-methionine (R)-S-oxide reductase